MTSAVPRIGFDRFISLEWAVAALRVRAGFGTLNELHAILDSAGLGVAARKKTQTVLNRLWLEPRPELADFAAKGATIFKAYPNTHAVAFHWGMAIAAYPFFGKVAEIAGRLFALQGDCSSAEVHRRMSENYGEREGIQRTTDRIIQSQASWGTMARAKNSNRLIRQNPIVVSNDRAVAWLLEAGLRYAGKALPIPTPSSLAVLYPFILDQPIACLASQSPNLALHSGGGGGLLVGLRW